jgi:hypothetical protein
MTRQILLAAITALSSAYASDVQSGLPSGEKKELVYYLDKSQLDSESWREAIATAQSHMEGSREYTLMRIVLKNSATNETIDLVADKIKDLTPKKRNGCNGEICHVQSGEFVIFEHIESTKRRNKQDPLLLRSSLRGEKTIWVDVPQYGEVQVLGDVIVKGP